MIEINNYFQGPIKSLKKIKPQLMQNTNDNVMSAHLLLIQKKLTNKLIINKFLQKILIKRLRE